MERDELQALGGEVGGVISDLKALVRWAEALSGNRAVCEDARQVKSVLAELARRGSRAVTNLMPVEEALCGE